MSCSIGSELTLDAMLGEQLVRLGDRRHPFAGTFELTERCNLACVHCYINRPARSSAARARELSAAQIIGILDQVAAAGCLSLLLTGGEILLRPDFPRVYRHAVQRGLLVTLFTNGTLMTERIAAMLADWPPWSLEITLYGTTQETCERVTRTPGSHSRCLAGIDLALRRGLPLALKTVVLRENRHELQDMRAFAAQLQVDFRYDGLLWPRAGGRGEVQAQGLSPQEIVDLDADDPERAGEWQRLAGMDLEAGRDDHVYRCGAGRHSFHVDSAGRLSPCIMTRRPAFDLLELGFGRAWEEGLAAAIAAKRSVVSACSTCYAGAVCNQCPGWSQLVHGDDETPAPVVCELARLRAARFEPSSPRESGGEGGRGSF